MVILIYNLPHLVAWFSFKSPVLHWLYLPHDLIPDSRDLGKPTFFGNKATYSNVYFLAKEQIYRTMFVGSNFGLKHLVKTWQYFDWTCLPLILKKLRRSRHFIASYGHDSLLSSKTKGIGRNLWLFCATQFFQKWITTNTFYVIWFLRIKKRRIPPSRACRLPWRHYSLYSC